jgi:hypothetical protein
MTLPQTIQRISLWSTRFRLALSVVLIALPSLAIASLLVSRSFGGVVHLNDIAHLDLSTVPALAALFISIGAMLDLLLRLLPLLFLRRLLGFWGRGNLLSQASARALELTGIAIALGALSDILIAPLTSLMVYRATGTETLPFSVKIDLAALIAGGVIYLVGMVMREAARVAEEAELTI